MPVTAVLLFFCHIALIYLRRASNFAKKILSFPVTNPGGKEFWVSRNLASESQCCWGEKTVRPSFPIASGRQKT